MQDIPQINRYNFRTLTQVLSRPGESGSLLPAFGSYVLGCGSVLLFSQVSYCNLTNEDFSLLDSLTRSKKAECAGADYVFTQSLESSLLDSVKRGSFKEPEFSASLIYCHKGDKEFNYVLKGPGIDGSKQSSYPLEPALARHFVELNKEFPIGFERYFLNMANGAIKALSRTTHLEVV